MPHRLWLPAVLLSAVALSGSCDSTEDPCRAAKDIRSDLIAKHGDPTFRCVTDFTNGALVEIWCCVAGKRQVHYERGNEAGCVEAGLESYDCGSTELPADVLTQVQQRADGQCAPLLDGTACP